MEMKVIEESLQRDLNHFYEQVKVLEEFENVGISVWEEEFIYVKSLKEKYIENLRELVEMIKGINENLEEHQKNLRKAEWKVIRGNKTEKL
jgi:hypothetical protein